MIQMNNTQLLITVLVAAAMTICTRAVSFLVFRGGKAPAFITWMGTQLPRAVMAMLLVYCLKDIDLAAHPFGIPALAGVAVTAALHVWKKQMMLSICGGTAVYMLLLRLMA